MQAKLIEEIDFLDKGKPLTYDDLESKLPFMDAVIKEAMRLLPPAHLIIRELQEKQTYGGALPRCVLIRCAAASRPILPVVKDSSANDPAVAANQDINEAYPILDAVGGCSSQ